MSEGRHYKKELPATEASRYLLSLQLIVIHSIEYHHMSMACGVEQLVLGDEIIGMVKRFLRGIDFSPEHIARDLLAKVGPGGEFLSQNHTMNHFKNELWRPTIFTRNPINTWRDGGKRDTEDHVREKIRNIVENHRPEPLSDAVIDNLERIKNEGQRVLTEK